MGRSTYSDADKARVYVVLTTNEGNVKRTARDTQVPENTVRRWKKEWEDNGPPKIDEEIQAAVTDYVSEMEKTRDLSLTRMHEKLEKGEGTLPQIATVFGVLTDKIDRARGIGTNHHHEHRLTLPSPEELRAALGSLVTGAQAGHALREAEIIDAEIVDEQLDALPSGS